MKASDFHPEHFEQGRSFKKSDFSAYLEASANLTKTIYTRYFPSVGAGLLLSFLFSRGAGGFAGNILALVCIFGGLIVGGIFNARAAREVNELAKRLGITRADVALARRHVKNGTTAWSGGDGSAAGEEDESLSKKTPEAEQSAAYQSARFPAALPEKEARALWAALFLTAGWFLLLLFQLSFTRSFAFMSSGLSCLAAAVLGSAVYLLSRNRLRWRLAGGGFGFISLLQLAFSNFYGNRADLFVGKDRFIRLFSLCRDPFFMQLCKSCLVAGLLSLTAVLIFSLLRKKSDKHQTLLCALSGSAVYLSVWILPWRLKPILASRAEIALRIFLGNTLLPHLAAALSLYCVCMAVYSLCNMPQTKVKLRGIGLAWCWLALLGSISALVITLRNAFLTQRLPGERFPAAYLILGLSALLGYLLLLLKRRIGLYFILLGVGLVLGSRLVQALAILATSGNTGLSLNILIQTVLGALNPLFAWLAVRAGTAGDPGQLSPVSASVEHVGKRAGTAANSTETADAGKIRKSAADWMPLVDRLAHFQTFSFDRSEESAMGEELLAGGNTALQAIVAYLSSCACGRQSSYWWSNAAYLVKLIAKFPGADHESLYKKLMAPETNIWEYHMQIKDVAEQELLNLKKSSPEYDGTVISEEDARAELKALNASGSAEERIRRAIDMRPSVENWSDENKAFYYFIIGDALRMRDRADKRRYPFYAAQVFYQAAKTSLGWHELLNSGDFEGLKPSPENAKRLHEQFPLPELWEDLLKPEA